MIKRIELCFVVFLVSAQTFAQDFTQQILTYRNVKHENFISNPYAPIRAHQVSLLDYYVPNEDYKVKAKVELLVDEQPFRMPTYDGTSNLYKKYAILHFQLGDQTHRLTTYQSVNTIGSTHLFLPFLDETSGTATYGGGRYLDLNINDIKDAEILVDFNKSYNPYCAYSIGYRCPQPPSENTLKIQILAGEKNYHQPKNERIVNKSSAKNFSDAEKEIITNGKGQLRVYLITDPDDLEVLRKTSEDIRVEDPLLDQLAKRMLATVQSEEHAGVGIAAPQVGVNKNVIWVQRFDKEGKPFEFYINPKIIWRSKLIRFGGEGCLSIPDRREEVQRSYAIRLQYWSKEGEIIEENIEGFTAVIFQHEVDHLYGILYTDRMEEQVKKENLFLKDKIEFAIPSNSILP